MLKLQAQPSDGIAPVLVGHDVEPGMSVARRLSGYLDKLDRHDPALARAAGTAGDLQRARSAGHEADDTADRQTGLQLLTDNMQAFAVRAASARSATRSLDLQYYYWKKDLTGGLLMNEVIKAADRGVRVRLLIDDINTRGRDRTHRALDSHPNIEVRLFNPTLWRENALMRAAELVLRVYSMNRRMHHKAWIVDGDLAVIGGRNIGDAYFDAAEASNFRDMDLVVRGHAVQQACDVFERFWTSDVVASVGKAGPQNAQLAKLRRRLAGLADDPAAQPYLEQLREETGKAPVLPTPETMHWTETARIVSDPPEKASGVKDESWLAGTIEPVLMSARKAVQITSPYFIPRSDGSQRLLDLFKRGVDVSVLTNSLAATDVAAVHGSYTRYRKRLVEGGIKLFELRARREESHDISLFGSRGASLHTKAFVVDGCKAFVGSFNFDPRSASLNTEMGILFDHPALAKEMQSIFAAETEPKRSYRLALAEGRTLWHGEAGNVRNREPDASLRRRIVAWIVSILPVQSQL